MSRSAQPPLEARDADTGGIGPETIVVGQGLPGARTLGGLLRERRSALGRRAEDLAEELDVSAGYVRSIERGERAPAPGVATKLLRALQLNPQPSDTRADLEFETDGRKWMVEFKHWASPAASVMVSTGGGKTHNMLAAVMSQATHRHRGRSNETSGETAQLIGEIVQRVARMSPDQLRGVTLAIDAIEAGWKQDHASGDGGV